MSDGSAGFGWLCGFCVTIRGAVTNKNARADKRLVSRFINPPPETKRPTAHAQLACHRRSLILCLAPRGDQLVGANLASSPCAFLHNCESGGYTPLSVKRLGPHPVVLSK